MSFISPIATDTNGQPKQTGSLQTLGKDEFLQLLVTKLEYQDPLNPTSDEDFVAQLAQFSSLEQMTNISDAISESNQWDFLQMQSLNNVMASGLIGREVTASFNGFIIDGQSTPSVSYDLAAPAQTVTIDISDETGQVIRTIEIDNAAAGVSRYTWDGLDSRGNAVADGYYSVDIRAEAANGSQINVSTELVGTVDRVVYREGAAYLVVDGVELALGDVQTIGMPSVTENEE